MQNKSHQRPDYASFIIPGKDTKPVEEQARNFLLSARIAIKRERVEVGEFNRGYFDKELARTFNRNAAVHALRSRRPNLLHDARKAFYDFTIALKELETSASPDVRNAVVTLIANELLNKPVEARPAPVLQRVKAEPKKPQERVHVAPPKTATKPRKKAQAQDAHAILDKQTLLYQRAEKILNSTLDPVQQKRVLALGKIPEGFEERLSGIFDNDPSVAAIRAKTPELLAEIMQEFRAFKTAVEVLNYQHISDEIQHAALRIITDKFLTKKPQKYNHLKISSLNNQPKNLLLILDRNLSTQAVARKTPILIPAIMEEFSSFYEKALSLNDKARTSRQEHSITPKILDAILDKIVKKILRDHRRKTTPPKKNPTQFTAKDGPVISKETKERFKKPKFLSDHKQKMKDVHKDPAYVLFRAVQISEGVKRRYEENPDYTTSVSEGLKEHYEDPKNIAAHSRRMKKRHEDPVYAAAHLKRLEKVWADTEKNRSAEISKQPETVIGLEP
jgi:hypothetical protein